MPEQCFHHNKAVILINENAFIEGMDCFVLYSLLWFVCQSLKWAKQQLNRCRVHRQQTTNRVGPPTKT